MKRDSIKTFEEVLENALWAPLGMNKQDWKIVVVRGKQRDQLLEIVSKSDHSLPTPPRKEGVIKWVGF
jgi:nitroreductase